MSATGLELPNTLLELASLCGREFGLGYSPEDSAVPAASVGRRAQLTAGSLKPHGDRAMDAISAEEWHLTSFFEVVPKYPDPGSPWPYTMVLYEVKRDDVSLSCTIFGSRFEDEVTGNERARRGR